MAQKQLTIISVLKSKPGKEQEVKQRLLSEIEPIRRRDGVINFDLHQDLNDLTRFMLHENWVSREHFEAYHKDRVPGDKAFRAKVDELLAEPIAPSMWEMVSKSAL